MRILISILMVAAGPLLIFGGAWIVFFAEWDSALGHPPVRGRPIDAIGIGVGYAIMLAGAALLVFGVVRLLRRK